MCIVSTSRGCAVDDCAGNEAARVTVLDDASSWKCQVVGAMAMASGRVRVVLTATGRDGSIEYWMTESAVAVFLMAHPIGSWLRCTLELGTTVANPPRRKSDDD